jgi:hypothetical protein
VQVQHQLAGLQSHDVFDRVGDEPA